MQSLILVAHGSRRATSNDEVRRLAEVLADKAGSDFRVSCAFLELAEPSIPEGIEAAIQDGADKVLVLPYFLSAGRHVVEDVPGLVDTKRAEHPDVDIQVTDYLGAAGSVADLLLSIAKAH